MFPPYRKTWLLILLAVLASHALLALHASSHAIDEQLTCELCTHYTGFENAPPPAAPDIFPRSFEAPPATGAALSLPAVPLADCRQRGPPLTA